MTEMIAEMDELLEKKKMKIESLISQLQIPPIDAKDEVFDDFCLDLEVPAQKIGFLELQKERKMLKQKSQFKKNQNLHVEVFFVILKSHSIKIRKGHQLSIILIFEVLNLVPC